MRWEQRSEGQNKRPRSRNQESHRDKQCFEGSEIRIIVFVGSGTKHFSQFWNQGPENLVQKWD